MVCGSDLRLWRTGTAMPKPQTNPKGYGNSTFDTERRPNQFLPHFMSPQMRVRPACPPTGTFYPLPASKAIVPEPRGQMQPETCCSGPLICV